MSLLLAILQALVLFAAAPLLSGITRGARPAAQPSRTGVLRSTAISSNCSPVRASRRMPRAGCSA